MERTQSIIGSVTRARLPDENEPNYQVGRQGSAAPLHPVVIVGRVRDVVGVVQLAPELVTEHGIDVETISAVANNRDSVMRLVALDKHSMPHFRDGNLTALEHVSVKRRQIPVADLQVFEVEQQMVEKDVAGENERIADRFTKGLRRTPWARKPSP